MTTRPEVLAVRRDGEAVELDLRIPADLDFFPDHFPRFAMLPGVVQVDWAIAYAREHLGVDGDFRSVSALKFQHPILPRSQATLRLERRGARETRFTFVSARRVCSSGRVTFADGA